MIFVFYLQYAFTHGVCKSCSIADGEPRCKAAFGCGFNGTACVLCEDLKIEDCDSGDLYTGFCDKDGSSCKPQKCTTIAKVMQKQYDKADESLKGQVNIDNQDLCTLLKCTWGNNGCGLSYTMVAIIIVICVVVILLAIACIICVCCILIKRRRTESIEPDAEEGSSSSSAQSSSPPSIQPSTPSSADQPAAPAEQTSFTSIPADTSPTEQGGSPQATTRMDNPIQEEAPTLEHENKQNTYLQSSPEGVAGEGGRPTQEE